MLEHRSIRGVTLGFEWIDNDGELIVFLHGVGADRTSWEPQVRFFSQLGYSVAAVDMRGTGESQARDERGIAVPISIADFAADVQELILELGFEGAHWVGNSMGGVIVMEALTARFPSVRHVVLSNTFAHFPDFHVLLPRPAQALRTKSLEAFAKERIPAAHRPDIDPKTLEASVRAMASKDVETYLASWRETWSHDYREALKQVRCQALVLTGSLDKLTPPALGLEISGLIPN